MKKFIAKIVVAFLLFSPLADACSIFTVVRDGQVLMGNNEDYILPGVLWFVPAKDGNFGRVNVGFEKSFAQGSMNEKGLSFDGAALNEIPWEPDPDKPSPDNLVDLIMNKCATVKEAIDYFETHNCSALANSQIMFADSTGDSAVITWMPEKGLSVLRLKDDHLIVTNNRLEASGYRDQRFMRAKQELIKHSDASLDTMVAVMDAIHQHGPLAFTSYSTVYDLKNKKMFIYNLANYGEMHTFDLAEELAKGPKFYKMKSLFEKSPRIRDIKKNEQRMDYGTQIVLEESVLEKYAGSYAPQEAPDVRFFIERSGSELLVINPGQPTATLYPETATVFRIKPDRGQVSFELDKQGQVIGLTLSRGNDLKALRVSDEK